MMEIFVVNQINSCIVSCQVLDIFDLLHIEGGMQLLHAKLVSITRDRRHRLKEMKPFLLVLSIAQVKRVNSRLNKTRKNIICEKKQPRQIHEIV